jgi:hypothetical protein
MRIHHLSGELASFKSRRCARRMTTFAGLLLTSELTMPQPTETSPEKKCRLSLNNLSAHRI